MPVSQSKLAQLTPNLMILWISACSFGLCGSMVANPIIYTGFVRVLENLESPGILLWHFPGLESPGKRPLVLESSGNMLTQLKIWSAWEAVRKINIEILGLSGLKWILELSKNQFESWKSPGKVLEICFWRRVRTLFTDSYLVLHGMKSGNLQRSCKRNLPFPLS